MADAKSQIQEVQKTLQNNYKKNSPSYILFKLPDNSEKSIRKEIKKQAEYLDTSSKIHGW